MVALLVQLLLYTSWLASWGWVVKICSVGSLTSIQGSEMLSCLPPNYVCLPASLSSCPSPSPSLSRCVCVCVCVWFVRMDICGHKEGEKRGWWIKQNEMDYIVYDPFTFACGRGMWDNDAYGRRTFCSCLKLPLCCFVQDSDAPLHHIVFQTIAGL